MPVRGIEQIVVASTLTGSYRCIGDDARIDGSGEGAVPGRKLAQSLRNHRGSNYVPFTH